MRVWSTSWRVVSVREPVTSTSLHHDSRTRTGCVQPQPLTTKASPLSTWGWLLWRRPPQSGTNTNYYYSQQTASLTASSCMYWDPKSVEHVTKSYISACQSCELNVEEVWMNGCRREKVAWTHSRRLRTDIRLPPTHGFWNSSTVYLERTHKNDIIFVDSHLINDNQCKQSKHQQSQQTSETSLLPLCLKCFLYVRRRKVAVKNSFVNTVQWPVFTLVTEVAKHL